MSDVSSIGFIAALGFLFVVFCAFINGLINQLRNRKKQPKISVNKPIVNEKLDPEEEREERELSREDSEGDGLFLGDPLFPEEFEED
jgi:hypothetical protein